MRYCADCGTGHECEAESRSGPNPDIEIARINADRDKYVARVTARMARDELDTAEDIAETQAEAEIESAAAEAEIVAAAVEAGIEPEPEPEPVIVQEVAAEPEEEMPPREDHHMPSAPAKPRSYFGF